MPNKRRIKEPLILLLLITPLAVMAQLDDFSSNLPIVVIETGSQQIVDDPRIVVDMGIICNGENQVNRLTDPYNDYQGKISIEYRGHTSQDFPKKSYGLETQFEDGTNRNVSLMGLPEENDWVLYAPYSDKTLIRNILAYRLSRELGHYAPRTRSCELILNGEYQGVYVLVEKIKRDDNRVDIATLNPDEVTGDDVTGGYIIKVDKQIGNSGPLWESSRGGIFFQYEYPKHDEIAYEQKAYIKTFIDALETALVSDHFSDPWTGYRKYLDAGSAVDFFIVNELARNLDAYFLSYFMYKVKESEGGKLYMGPVWDFNLSFGNADYRDAFKTEGFQLDRNPGIWWWYRLIQDPVFLDDIRNRWYSIRERQFSDDSILSVIDSLTVYLEEAQERNFTRWNILGWNIWPNYYVGDSYEDETGWMSAWILDRLHWMDGRMDGWTGIDMIPGVTDPGVFPNPFTTSFSCRIELFSPGDLSLVLYDMNGTPVHTLLEQPGNQAGMYQVEWDASSLPPSMYVLIVRLNGEIVASKKVIKL